ncbi:hypothetical protein Tsubulata_047857, partial [Turnera subulata]
MNHFEVRKIRFRDMSSLLRASVYFSDAYYAQWETVLKSLAHVKHLATQNFGLKYCLSDILPVFENLKSLSIEDIFQFRDSVIEIRSRKLKELNLSFCRTYAKPQSLEIDCPNLTSLVMNHFEVRKIHFRDVSSLLRASVYFSDAYYAQWETVMKSLAHVKHLAAQNFGLKFLQPKNLSDHGLFESPLSNVKHLEIRTSYSKFEVLAIAAFLHLLPNLETLILEPPVRLVNRKNTDHRGSNFHFISNITWICS